MGLEWAIFDPYFLVKIKTIHRFYRFLKLPENGIGKMDTLALTIENID